MTEKFDLFVLPIHRKAGQDSPDLPGLYLAKPPRGAARSRQEDRLALSLFMTGTATFSPEAQRQLLEGIAKTYYQTGGAATSAMRAAVEGFNQYLLERNLRTAGQGLQATALLTLLACRGDQLYIGQSGDTHLFTVTRGTSQYLHDPQMSGRGLGLGRSAQVRFSHLSLEPGALVLVTPDPPGPLTAESLRPAVGRKLHLVQQALNKFTAPDWRAVLVQAVPGTEQTRLYARPAAPPETAPLQPAGLPDRFSKPPADKATSVSLPEPEQPRKPVGVEISPPVPSLESQAEIVENLPVQPETPAPTDVDAISPAPDEQPAEPEEMPVEEGPVDVIGDASHASPEVEAAPTPKNRAWSNFWMGRRSRPAPPQPETPPASTALQPPQRPVFGPAVLAIGRAFKFAGGQVIRALRALLGGILPGREMFTIPPTTMAFIAVAVPVMIVALASLVYIRRGRIIQYQNYLNYAEAAALNARGKTDPVEERRAWDAVLFYVDLAEEYQETDETILLRAQAFQVMDTLDGTQRIQLESALASNSLGEVTITQMLYNGDALYALDSDAGRVLRFWRSGRGYELDASFQCGLNKYGAYIVGALVDITPLPAANSFGAALLAMDGNGILVYCPPDGQPLAYPLIPPDNNWGSPRSMVYSNGWLYILDPQTNAVWVYVGEDFTFGSRPFLFFDNEVPRLQDVVDIAINGSELYLLHTDGSMTICQYRTGDTPTQCTERAAYTDTRGSVGKVETMTGAAFSQIVYAPPPGPAFYMLDPYQQALYQFSTRLVFQRQFRPYSGSSLGNATAFAVDGSQRIFMAFDNQIFVSPFP